MSELSGPSGKSSVDFISGWENLMGPLHSIADGKFLILASTLGGVLIVVAIIRFLWKKGSGGAVTLIIPLILGAILAGPELVVPLLLGIAQFVVNFFLALVS